MNAYLAIALGSALGGVARYALARAIDLRWPHGDPAFIGTLIVNVLGCLAIGLAAAFSEREWVKLFVMVGILGGFTTFSSFGLQTIRLADQQRWGAAALCVGLSLGVCLLAVWLGMVIGRAVRLGDG